MIEPEYRRNRHADGSYTHRVRVHKRQREQREFRDAHMDGNVPIYESHVR